ncbi:MAG: permease, partial [Verrucomicrobiales bacterium]
MGSLGRELRPQAPLFLRSMNTETPPEAMPPCCGGDAKKRDWFLWISAGACTAAVLVGFWQPAWLQSLPRLQGFCHSVIMLFGQMWWGLALGIIAIGILSHVPRDWISAALGKGIWRALCMGLLFDLCSHGILMVGAKLYERGATIGQTMAFLIASPWNSFSLTLILVGLIGLPWTVTFILLSALVGFTTGTLADHLVKIGRLPGNPQRSEPDAGFSLRRAIKDRLRTVRWRLALIPALLLAGLRESGAIIRWLLLGVILASLLRVWVSDEMFSTWFGATWT